MVTIHLLKSCGVDDQIRELFQTALATAKALPEVAISTVKEAFEAFATEFESMIFKEESILLMILLESFTRMTGFRLRRRAMPTAMPSSVRQRNGCQNDRVSLEEKSAEEPVKLTRLKVKFSKSSIHQKASSPFLPPKEKEAVLDRHSQQAFGNGYLSVEQANLILNHLPMEITFVNKDDIFQYYK